MEKSKQLLPCPFCGEAALVAPSYSSVTDKRKVFCQGNGCDVMPMVMGATPEEAAELWNNGVYAQYNAGTWRMK